VMTNDPALSLDSRLKRLKDLGIAGVTNWPAVGFTDGTFRSVLEGEGLTVEAEIEMLIQARKAGFVTFGFALTANDAAAMAQAGVDALVLNVGWTHATHDIFEKSDRLQHASVKINEMIDAVQVTGANSIFLFFGGAVTLPEDSIELYRRTQVHGYGGGSSFERIPIARLLTNTVRQFRSIPRYTEPSSAGESMGELVGSSPIMQRLYRLIERVAPYDVSVCIEGESGAGKELVAMQLHRLSYRDTQPFITLNCGAIPDTLLESEFFGHEKGAFTGAVAKRLGKFELADRGTLFLDEVAELSPKAQVSLLRVLQQREISRVGGEKSIPLDVRIITATHRNFKALVEQDRFRADLYFRLNMITLDVPPLRARVNDIPLLVKNFINELAPQFEKTVLGVTPDFLDRLIKHAWPGNVRELKHILCRAILLEDGPILEGDDFAPLTASQPSQTPLTHTVLAPAQPTIEAESNALLNALQLSGGNKSKASRLLGISRKTLYARLKKLHATE
ncbi:MAG: AAA domain-containing protein, partial [bacterium]|nr:AAA domain-containing protein [bacterium]